MLREIDKQRVREGERGIVAYRGRGCMQRMCMSEGEGERERGRERKRRREREREGENQTLAELGPNIQG